ncbi:Hypothetical protein R9X50_00663800 [Acrodontium crateriforme]|uniref:WD40 repeat-like protein n=1 Tax=Acrodontium crateriforme TaxID=150365 RepID=A0AAQ3MA12_9PEZI|nr:Hypothetical protein R9X50_00663800 [Acrodontium crateriforme]
MNYERMVTGKRKREVTIDAPKTSKKTATKAPNADIKKSNATANGKTASTGASTVNEDDALNVQIVTGSYERILHGFSARIPHHLFQTKAGKVEKSNRADTGVSFSDTFLFAAHTSAIRCLALSPGAEANKRLLATGSSDERINLYSISTAPPSSSTSKPNLPTLASTPVSENSRNRSLGSLVHHDRAITSLHFATKTKLFSGAEDSTIAISRTRDWTVLSSIKAPIPKPSGRPSGDTAGPGEFPAGINDFAIHPSQKLMLSVGRGERCMRLWNLMTGKKAGVLNFDRDLLMQVGETRHSSGESRRVLWAEDGGSFVVGFERGAAVFGIDSKPTGIIKPSPSTKLHQMKFLPQADNILVASTEDGRILFFHTETPSSEDIDVKNLPICACVGQLGGRDAGFPGRIKDFDIIPLSSTKKDEVSHLVVTASSDGAIRLWALDGIDASASSDGKAKEVGKLLGTHETGNRITCMGAFVMDGVDTADDVESDGDEDVNSDDE